MPLFAHASWSHWLVPVADTRRHQSDCSFNVLHHYCVGVFASLIRRWQQTLVFTKQKHEHVLYTCVRSQHLHQRYTSRLWPTKWRQCIPASQVNIWQVTRPAPPGMGQALLDYTNSAQLYIQYPNTQVKVNDYWSLFIRMDIYIITHTHTHTQVITQTYCRYSLVALPLEKSAWRDFITAASPDTRNNPSSFRALGWCKYFKQSDTRNVFTPAK